MTAETNLPGATMRSTSVVPELEPDRIEGSAKAQPLPATGTGRSVGRLVPERPFPPYAYLPGRFPHPVRDPRGHSFRGDAAAPPTPDANDPDAWRWGADLFNHGYYWEAHEAWEERWRASPKGEADRQLLHGLILLAAAGVKLREGKWDAAVRHGGRAASFIRMTPDASPSDLASALGWPPSRLATMAERAVLTRDSFAEGQIVFGFALGLVTH